MFISVAESGLRLGIICNCRLTTRCARHVHMILAPICKSVTNHEFVTTNLFMSFRLNCLMVCPLTPQSASLVLYLILSMPSFSASLPKAFPHFFSPLLLAQSSCGIQRRNCAWTSFQGSQPRKENLAKCAGNLSS